MIHKVDCIMLACDGCKKEYEQSSTDYSIFMLASDAIENAEDEGWSTEGDKHYCETCSLLRQACIAAFPEKRQLMNYQLSQDGKTIKGMPEMEKWDRLNSRLDDVLNSMSKEDWQEWDSKRKESERADLDNKKHVASLPIFNCHPSLSEKYEPGAVLVEGKDFELHPCCDHICNGECIKLGATQTAFPIAVREGRLQEMIPLLEALIYYSQISTVENVVAAGMPTHEDAWRKAQKWLYDNCDIIDGKYVLNQTKQHYTISKK